MQVIQGNTSTSMLDVSTNTLNSHIARSHGTQQSKEHGPNVMKATFNEVSSTVNSN